MRVVSLAALSAFVVVLGGCGGGDDRPEQTDSPVAPVETAAAGPKFGETPAERQAREAAGLGDYWVKTDVATEHSSPGGPVVNRVYYRQKFTVYEKRGDWYRTVEDGFTPRWTRASELTDTPPPERPRYDGPAEHQDSRIAADAIPNPGEYGLTRADIDIIRKGAKLVLQTRPDCTEITTADKSVSKPNTYYVTCRIGGSVQNVFFTRAEALAAEVQ